MNPNKIPFKIQKYLEPGINVDSNSNEIQNKAKELIGDEKDTIKKAKILYEFVRDEIDEKGLESIKASEILLAGHGACYNKSVLLVALCRSSGIPARISFDEVYIKNYKDLERNEKRNLKFLHGIIEMYLHDKWIKYDPTGNEKRWKIWIQEDPILIDLPLIFSIVNDVVFPSSVRVTLKRTDYNFFDWTEVVDQLVEKFNQL